MIKNIIFDLGGVVLNIDYDKTSQAFKDLGLKNFDSLYSQAQQSHLFDDFECGKITAEQFRERMRTLTGIIFCDMELDKAWNAMLLDLPAYRIDLLHAAKKKYRTFLLSNTNIIHYEAYTNNLQEQYKIKSLGELFEKEYYSHEIGMRKPHVETFNYVLKDAQIHAHETLFIDDSKQHLEGAQQAGLQTFFMDRSRDLNLNHVLQSDGTLKI